MATKEQIFKALAPFQDKGVDRKILGKGIGEDYRHFQSQLDRLVKRGLLRESHHQYILTENGRKELAEMLHPDLDESLEEKVSEITDYQQFIRLGKLIGVIPMSLIKVTTEHIWACGDYRDLKWVAEGLQQVGIRRDLASRWLYAWGAHLKQPLPMDLPQGLKTAEGTPFQFSITQDDLNRLSASDFKTVWADLGKIIRGRGQPLEEKKTV